MFNIFVTSASRRVSLLRAFRRALINLGLSGRVITCDMDPLSAGFHVSDGYYVIPPARSKHYLPAILEICQGEKVKILVPATDIELEVLADKAEKLAAIGTKLVLSPPSTIKACRDKYKSAAFFQENGLPYPQTWLPEEIRPLLAQEGPEIRYPLFIKPRDGRGSIDSFKINNPRELDFFLDYVPNPVIQEFIEGPEYTIDLLADREGEIIAVVPRERVSTSAGLSQKGRTIKDPVLMDFAIAVARALKVVGPVNIQAILSPMGPVCVEVNPRFAGGVPLTIAAGVDFPELIVRMYLGEKIKPRIGDFAEGLLMLRYDEAVFVPEGGAPFWDTGQ